MRSRIWPSDGLTAARPLQPAQRRGTRALTKARNLDYHYGFVEFVSEHLADLSRGFGGDLRAMLILAVIGQVRIAAVTQQARGLPAREEESGITASRLADVIGIPRSMPIGPGNWPSVTRARSPNVTSRIWTREPSP